MPRHDWRDAVNLRHRVYEILEHGTIGDRTGLIVGRLIVILIIVNLLAIILESVPTFQTEYGPLFTAVEILSLVVFSLEYGLRVWVAVEHAPHRHLSARKARWKFISSPLGLVDLLAVLPFWFAFALPNGRADQRDSALLIHCRTVPESVRRPPQPRREIARVHK